jgi:hypothetical protein
LSISQCYTEEDYEDDPETTPIPASWLKKKPQTAAALEVLINE